MIRYLVALIVAAVIIGGGWAFCRQVRGELVSALRKTLDEAPAPAAASGPGQAEDAAEREAARKALDAGEIPSGEWGFEISDTLMQRTMLADMLSGLWPFWVALVTGVCLTGAWAAGRIGRRSSRPVPEGGASPQLPSADQP